MHIRIIRVLSLLFFIFLINVIEADEGIFSEPIDIVYLWVDSSDLNWRKIKNHYKELEKNGKVISDAVTDNRFTNNDELKYALRSVWMHAPFIHHIFIVTMGQVPDWLMEHPMVSIVDHKDIFLCLDNLPTFNSQAIESNIHRIPGLSEYFIYSNDDMFFGRPVKPGDFFTEDKKVKVVFDAHLSPSGAPSNHLNACCQAACNTNDLLNRHYRSERRHFLAHSPVPLVKSYFYETEKKFPYVFLITVSHRFRSRSDYTITNGLLHYDWMYKGKCIKGNLKNFKLNMKSCSYEKTRKRLKRVADAKPHTFCLQDNMKKERGEAVAAMQDFLEASFPDKAPWEK